MSLTVYQMPHSPFCIPITQALDACGAEFETRDVPNWDRSEIIRLTNGAYYQVPLLVHNGQPVFESGGDTQDIPRYIDTHFTGGKLFPEAIVGIHAIVVDFLEDEVEGVTFRLVDPQYIDSIPDLAGRVMTIRHKERKFGRGCVEAWRHDAPSLRAQADRLLDRFDRTLRHSTFLFGAAPVYADFLLFGILGNLTYNGWNELNPETQAALLRWQRDIENYRF